MLNKRGGKQMKQSKGITLIALIVTIIVLLILASITMAMVVGDNGILKKASETAELTRRKNAEEKVTLLLGEYEIERNTNEKTLTDFFEEKVLTGEIQDIVEDTETEIVIEVDSYEFVIDKETLEIIGEPSKAGGIRPDFETTITKIDGTELTSGETEKALTVNITNIAQFGSNYTIEVKDINGNVITKQDGVVGDQVGQASFIIRQTGEYTIVVTGTKDGITKTTIKKEKIKVSMPVITTQFSKANGVIDIVWLDEQNNVIEKPISPKNFLGGLEPTKYDGRNWVPASADNTDNDWYNYVAQTGANDGKTSNWANARSSDENAYFVWIPRYAYKITYFDTVDNANAYRINSSSTVGIIGYSTIQGMIDVTSGRSQLIQGTEPINVIGTVKTEQYSEFIPHPAFEFDGSKAGLWIGKFECSGSDTQVKIVGNVEAIRLAKVNEIFTVCQEVKTIYNLVGDSHMIKNTEWGAVAYLTESKYGRNGAKVKRNNGNRLTGSGNYTSVSTQEQSTTGNIYGIYDMNGTSWEYVAGYIDNNEVKTNSYNTKLIEAVAKNKKYADIYPITTDEQSINYSNSKGMKGDGIYETSVSYSGSNSWNKEYSSFPATTYPVFMRGR